MRVRCPNCDAALDIILDKPSTVVVCPSCGSQVDAASGDTTALAPEIARQIGHYALLNLVGRGHFGEVWRARDTKLERIVAIKFEWSTTKV